MEKTSLFKANFGLIILSVSILIGCLIVTDQLTRPKNELPEIEDVHRHRLAGDMSATSIPLGVNTNSNDVTYHSELKIAEGESLFVQASNGDKLSISGDNITAKYYHVGEVLTVEFKQKGKSYLRYFTSPVSWGNE